MKYPEYFISATTEYATHERQVPAPLFRGSFALDGNCAARLVICGLGFYRVFCNGAEFTRGKLSSCPSNPDQILYYDTYDISEYIQKGNNTIGIMLGNGMLNCNGLDQCGFGNADYRSAPKTAFAILVDDEMIFSSQDAVKCYASPILYDDLREGESYDARLEQIGWNMPDFDDSHWADAIPAKRPKGLCVENMAPPVIVSEEISPVSFRKVNGGYIYEYPINTAGICRLQLYGKAGQKLTMQYVEVLNSEERPYIGNLIFPSTVRTQYNEYICKNGWQVYEPSFTYHGFRYVYVTGLEDDQATEQTMIMLRMHADLEKRAFLHTSVENVNRLCAMIDNSNLSNLLHFPTDCPHREKNGWAGDISVSAHQMALQYDMQGMFGEWMRMYRLSQRKDGALPGYVPTAKDGYEIWTGPSWSMSLFMCAYYLYRYHGNLQVTQDNADAMELYFDYLMSQRNEDGLIAFGLGDWWQTTVDYADRYTTPNEITDTLATIHMAEIMMLLFPKIGRTCEKYSEISQQLRNLLHIKWIDSSGYRCKCTTQTAQAMMIHYGIISSEHIESAVSELVTRIHTADDTIDVGILGGYVLFDVLSRNGYAELARKLILQTKAPSYGYFTARGETSLRESFMDYGAGKDEILLKNGVTISSLNHHYWGFVYTWFVENFAGVTINGDCKNPNYAQIRKPALPLEKTQFHYQFHSGKMLVQWMTTDKGLRLNLEIPADVTVSVFKNEIEELLAEGKYDIDL